MNVTFMILNFILKIRMFNHVYFVLIKVSIVPDNDKRTRCKTNNVHDTTHPIFDEKFSL